MMNPRVVTVSLIAWEYTAGRGTEDDPLRIIRSLCTTDGHLVAENDVCTEMQRTGHGFWKVHSGEASVTTKGTDE